VTNARRIFFITILLSLPVLAYAQDGNDIQKSSSQSSKGVRVITVPVSSRNKNKRRAEEGQNIDLALQEDGEEQQVLSIRDIGTNPIALAVLIQDDLTSTAANEIKPIATFINSLPEGSRVMVGYIGGGSLSVRQKFTTDLKKASGALRIPTSSQSSSTLNPFIQIREALKRFETLPTGRRAVLVISDGLDLRNGVDSSAPGNSLDLDRTIAEAQRRSVAVYAIFNPSVVSASLRNTFIENNGQSALQRLTEETGGRLYAQGFGAPVSFDPFLDQLGESLSRQFAITYLSTHAKKGFHKINIRSNRTDIELDYPHGYSF